MDMVRIALIGGISWLWIGAEVSRAATPVGVTSFCRRAFQQVIERLDPEKRSQREEQRSILVSARFTLRDLENRLAEARAQIRRTPLARTQWLSELLAPEGYFRSANPIGRPPRSNSVTIPRDRPTSASEVMDLFASSPVARSEAFQLAFLDFVEGLERMGMATDLPTSEDIQNQLQWNEDHRASAVREGSEAELRLLAENDGQLQTLAPVTAETKQREIAQARAFFLVASERLRHLLVREQDSIFFPADVVKDEERNNYTTKWQNKIDELNRCIQTAEADIYRAEQALRRPL